MSTLTEMGVGAISSFTYLQATNPPIDDAKHIAVAGLITIAGQLIMKLGNKLIATIGKRRKERKKKRYPQPGLPTRQ